MTTKATALKWLNDGYDITPIQVTYDRFGHASKSPFIAYATVKLDKTWILSSWKKTYEIGLVLSGEDYVVFDFDNMTVYEDFIKQYPDIQSGVREKSVSGRGIHVYFDNTEQVTQAINIIDGLDIKASKNNFVVVNPETDLSEVTDLPESLWVFYETNKANAKAVATTNQTRSGIIELDMITNGFGEPGSRNNNMSLLVWTLFTLGFNDAQTKAVIDLANEKSGLEQGEIDKTIETAWRKWAIGS